jgi:hypothetical protein
MEVRDGSDDSAHGQGTEARCARPQSYGGVGDAGRGSVRRAGVSRWGLSNSDTVSATVQTSPTTAIRSPRMLPPRPARPRPLSRRSPPSAVPCSARERPQWGPLSGDRHALRRGLHPSGSHARSAVRCFDSHGVMGQRSTGVKTYGTLLVQHARTTSNDCF